MTGNNQRRLASLRSFRDSRTAALFGDRTLLTGEQPVYLRREIAAPMASTGRDERDGFPCTLELGRRGRA